MDACRVTRGCDNPVRAALVVRDISRVDGVAQTDSPCATRDLQTPPAVTKPETSDRSTLGKPNICIALERTRRATLRRTLEHLSPVILHGQPLTHEHSEGQARRRDTGHDQHVTIRGKGAFVTHDPVSRWDLWTACGLEWCALQHVWCWGSESGPIAFDEVTRSPGRLIDEAFAARARGVDPWWWAWVIPSRVDAYVAQLAEDLQVAGEAAPTGIILNLELAEPGGARGAGRRAWDLAAPDTVDAATRLVRGVRAAWPGDVLVTSHGLQSRRMPWITLGALDGAMPQAYNQSCSYDSGFVRRCVDSYADGAFQGKTVVPLLGANSTPAACMRRYVNETEDARSPAAGWWAWTGLAASAAKRAEVAMCKLPPPHPPHPQIA